MKCGIGDYCYNISKKISANKNAEVSVITSIKSNLNSNEINIFPIIEKWDKSCIKIIIKKLKEIKPDIINIQFPNNEYEYIKLIFNILILCIKLDI